MSQESWMAWKERAEIAEEALRYQRGRLHEMRDLLEEWLKRPEHFPDAEWDKWIDGYEYRVREALR